ncbi:hypothetical protein U1Q18_020782 [Sarracenia purpurea var. burkii]
MSYSKRSRDSRSPSLYKQYGGSASRSVSRSRSRSCDSSIENPGNNLYVTGLSTRATKRDIEKHFSTEGKVEDIHLVVDPWTRESRGFCFVTMSTVEEADRCIKYLNRSILEGRVIMVEKARRRRGRTPTPGRYLGLRTIHGRKRNAVRHRSPSYSPHYRGRSPRYSFERDRSRSRSPYYSRRRSYSPYYGRRESYSPRYSRRRIPYSRSPSPYSRSPPVRRQDYMYSPYESPDHHYRRNRYRSVSRSISPDRYYRRSRYRSISRSISRSVSPRPRRSWRRSYSRSVSPRRLSGSYSRSISPGHRRRRYSRSISPRPRKSSWRRQDYSQDSYSSWSYSGSSRGSRSSRSISRSDTARSTSPSS